MELSNENIAKTVEDIQKFFEESKVSRRDVLKICLVVEEALIRWQEHFGTAHEFKIYKKRWFSVPKIIIRVKGEPFYPLQNDNEDDDTILSNEVMRRLLNLDEVKTTYRYENGYNELISFSTKEHKPLKIPGGSITIAMFVAIIFSFIVGFFPQDVQNILVEKVTSPSLSTLLHLIITVTVFMIFITVVSSICAIEDSTMIINVGSTVLKRFFCLDLFIITLTIAISLIFFPTFSIGVENSFEIGKIVELLLSIIPTNTLDAFIKGYALQVTIMAFLVGICITKIGNRVTNVKTFFTELNLLSFKIVESVFEIIPIVIFLCIFKMLLTSTLSDFLKVWQLIVAELIIFAIIILIMLICLVLRTKISISEFLTRISPAAIISFTTGSSIASLPESLEVSKNKLHIEEKFCNFWIPLSLVLFSPSKLIQLTIAGFYVMAFSGKDISLMEFLLIIFLAIQLSMATPNAAGGIVASFSILLTQIGLPLEFIGSLMIADVLTGNLFTGLNVLIRQCELMLVAHKMSFIKSDLG